MEGIIVEKEIIIDKQNVLEDDVLDEAEQIVWDIGKNEDSKLRVSGAGWWGEAEYAVMEHESIAIARPVSALEIASSELSLTAKLSMGCFSTGTIPLVKRALFCVKFAFYYAVPLTFLIVLLKLRLYSAYTH